MGCHRQRPQDQGLREKTVATLPPTTRRRIRPPGGSGRSRTVRDVTRQTPRFSEDFPKSGRPSVRQSRREALCSPGPNRPKRFPTATRRKPRPPDPLRFLPPDSDPQKSGSRVARVWNGPAGAACGSPSSRLPSPLVFRSLGSKTDPVLHVRFPRPWSVVAENREISKLAEREGFEPPVLLSEYTRSPGVPDQPLWHLSVDGKLNLETWIHKSRKYLKSKGLKCGIREALERRSMTDCQLERRELCCAPKGLYYDLRIRP